MRRVRTSPTSTTAPASSARTRPTNTRPSRIASSSAPARRTTSPTVLPSPARTTQRTSAMGGHPSRPLREGGYARRAMTTWLVPLESLARRRGGDDRRVIGGKAARLAWLVRHDFDVPEAWILPEDAFAQALRELPPGCEPRALLRAATGRAGYARAAEARDTLLSAPLP